MKPNPASTIWSNMFDACLPGRTSGSHHVWPAFWQHDPASEGSKQAWIDSTLRFHEITRSSLVKLTGPAHYQVADRGVEGSWQGAPLGERTFTRRAIIGAPCAVPLRYSPHDIASWVNNVKECNAALAGE